MGDADTGTEWILDLLKCDRIENFMDELNNKQNAESDRSKNCWIIKSTMIIVQKHDLDKKMLEDPSEHNRQLKHKE